MKKLKLYTLNMKYVRELAKADDRVMSISPQLGKQNRPFVGIVVVCESKDYCIPLSSPKPKHATMKNAVDFLRITDRRGKLIGVLNLNNMIPVNGDVIRPVNMTPGAHDSVETRKYKELLNDQLDWCNANVEVIVRKANRLYKLVTEHPERSRGLVKRCCDFTKLEALANTLRTRAAGKA
ncbi:MAG: type III toxin-antitoxin system ToxN/AbiQ family toxin [Coriobacteriales bacterium]|nr:type III toxin-antitoxin system ToxN/AbiQ family toxin [Coriobacteriales bacterium]